MARVAIELFFYLMFAWALMVICYGQRDTGHFWMTNGVDELVPRFDKVLKYMLETKPKQPTLRERHSVIITKLRL